LKRGAELLRIELAEQPAEGVVAGEAIGQAEKTTQEGLFRFGEFRHVHRALAAAQNRTQGNHQKLMEIMQPGVAVPRIF
jgi:hypothetical protein